MESLIVVGRWRLREKRIRTRRFPCQSGTGRDETGKYSEQNNERESPHGCCPFASGS